MAELSESMVCLRFFGDDLDPAELTELLGQSPTKSEKIGQIVVGEKSGKERVARTGSWRFDATKQVPGNLDAQISEVLDLLTDDIDVWQKLTARFKADVFCGLFMAGSNEGVSLSPSILKKLAKRELMIGFDIYDGAD